MLPQSVVVIQVRFRQRYCLPKINRKAVSLSEIYLDYQYSITIYFQHTVAKTYADPNIPEGVIELNMFSHLTMGSPERPAVATVAPHLHRYTTEVYRPRERVIHALGNASISTNILTRLHLVVNSQEPFLTYHSTVCYALNDLCLGAWSLQS
jgi:hypothetical protein